MAAGQGAGPGAAEQAHGEVTAAGDEEVKDAGHPWRAHRKTEENEGTTVRGDGFMKRIE